ncbi:hypothetical protein MJ876_15910, partial [Nocardioides sp. CFH 31398]|nr:hypothetical protein [Nocardioides sp. CFH 31398]
MDKTAGTPDDRNGSGLVDAGDRITYSFTVTNDGTVPITDVAISDALLAGAGTGVTCLTRALAVGASTSCTADAPYVVTAADERAGAVTNTATATGRDPDAGRVVSPADGTRTPTTVPAPSLRFGKTAGTPVDANGNGLVDAGDRVPYRFTVTNDGNVPVGSVAVVDDLAGPVTCGRTRLTPGQTTQCEADRPYTITPADQTSGEVVNTASATGTDPDGDRVVSGTDTTRTPVATAAPGLSMTKTAGRPRDLNDSGLVDAGDEIDYTFEVTNTGNVPVRVLRIDDPTVGSVACDVTVLAPGESTGCETVTPYVVTADDEEAGEYRNSATAVAEAPGSGTIRSAASSTTTSVVEPDPALVLEKSATTTDLNGSGTTDEGDEILYTFTVTNTGNVPLDDLAVEDPLLAGQPTPIGVTCDATRLGTSPATSSTTCTADAPYVVTAADEVAGRVTNLADATAVDPDGGPVTSPDDRTVTRTTLGDAELDVVKSATVTDVDDSRITDAGDEIAYTFVVTNTGNLTITDVTVDDPLAGAVTCQATELAPGEDTTCTADEPYVVTADDEDAARVTNTATARGTAPGVGAGPRADVASDPDTVNVGVTEQAAVLTLRKTASDVVDVNDSGLPDAGDEITYTFEVSNDGNVTVRDLRIVDDLLTDSDPAVAVTCDEPVLAPGARTTCTADGPYVVTEADEDAGEVVNTATAEGTGPRGTVTSNEAVATSEPVIDGEPALAIEKRAGTPVDVNDSGLVDAGDTVAYTFRVSNTGTVPVRGITVTDDLLPGGVTCPQARLAAGGAMTCTAAPYTITTADEGTDLVNTARVRGTDPDGARVDGGPSSTTTPVAVPAPSLAVDKQAGDPVDVNGSGLTDAGDTIAYRFLVENTGNVPVTVLRVVDPLVGDVACENVTIPVGQTFECLPLAPYTVTADDEQTGSVTNTAFARGEDPDGDRVRSEEDSTETAVDLPVTGLTLTKTAGTPVDRNDSGLVDAGDTVGYSFTVVNDGTVPLRDLTVSDPLLGAVTCEADTLAADGGSTTCTADEPYVVTEGDEQAGEVVNTATARAADPDGDTVADTDVATVEVATPAPALELEKTAGTPDDVNGSGLVDAGDTVLFTFTVTNTGTVPLSSLRVDDPLLAAADIDVTCDATALAVDGDAASTTCTADAPYEITTSDQLAGRVLNRATASALDPDDGDVDSEPDTTRTPVATPAPALALEKDASTEDVNDSGLVDAGDLVTYTFTVTNAGDVPLADLAVDDGLLSSQDPAITVSCEQTELAPGDDTTCTAYAAYEVSDADVDAGVLTNTATATATAPGVGRGPRPDVTSDPDSVNLPTTRQAPVLTLDKVAADPVDVNGSGITDAGDTIAYTFTVTNEGNVPVAAITVDDPVLDDADPADPVTCTPDRLAPGEQATCAPASDYVVTAADERAGRVLNVATARGEDPDGDPVASNEDSTTTPTVRQNTVLSLTKTAGDVVDVNGSGLPDEGDTIAYTFRVTNDGNVPVTGVTVADPLLGEVVCRPSARLAPGAVATCESAAPYVVTAADERAGEVVNTATATATGPDGADDVVTSPPASTTTRVVEPVRSLSLEKTAADPVDVDESGQTDAGDTIAFTFRVTNTGTVPVTDVAVSDPTLAAVDPPITVTCDADELEPGAATDCAASRPYVVTADDEATGEVTNTAVASATAPGVGTGPARQVTSPEDSTTTPVVAPAPDLVIEKAASVRDVNGSGLTDAGDEISYTFTVANEGNVTLRRVRVDDPLLAGATPPVTVTCERNRLVAGDTTTCAADAPYVVTEADEAAGSVDNAATARAVRGPADTPVASEADGTSTTVTAPVTGLTLVKDAAAPVDANDSGLTDAGDTVAYSFTVTNDSNVPVTGLVVDDELLAGLAPATTVTCEDTTLAANGGTTTCRADAPYRITAADEDAGEVVNTATATATDPDGDDVVSPEDTTTTPVVVPAPALGVEKSADAVDVNGSGAIDAGDTIAYSFVVTNEGDVPVSGVGIDDELLAGLVPAVGVTCEDTALAVGASTTCAADGPYVVTTTDERAGSVDNEATAVGLDPDDEAVTSPTDVTSTPTRVPAPSLEIDKSLPAGGIDDVEGDGIVDAGDTLTYAFRVTNTGNVPVTDLVVTDAMLTDADPAVTVECAADALQPGESTTCEQSAPYVVTAADEDARAVTNSATASGAAPGVGEGPRVDVVSDPDTVRVPVTAEADVLTLDKRAAEPVDVNGSGLVDAGDT